MARTRFSLPYIDQPLVFWEKLKTQFQPDIEEVYFPLIDHTVGSGRPLQPDKHLKSFLESRILPISVLMNPVVLPTQFGLLKTRLLKTIEHYLESYNLKGVTISNLTLAKEIKKTFPEIQTTASTLMEIGTEQQLLLIDNAFDVLVPSSRIIRDLKSLKLLREKFPGKLRLLVNESCLASCVYRTQHFYEMSRPEISYPCSLCEDQVKEKPWLSLSGSWILPQHLDVISGLYDELKLAGRVSLSNPDRFNHVFSSYVNRTPLKPNQIGGGPAAVSCPMQIDLDFYKKTLLCDKDCLSCSICKEYWEKNVRN